MDEFSEKLFNKNKEKILAIAADRYGVKLDSFNKLGSFESEVFEFEKGGHAYILKITHSNHRKLNQVICELNWIDHISQFGVPACELIFTNENEILFKIDLDESYFILYAFKKAPGSLTGPSDWNDSFIRQWGEITGKMHAATKSYQPGEPTVDRFQWHEDDSLNVRKHLPKEETALIERCEAHKSKLKPFSVDKNTYGIVHSDLHHGNFHYHDNIIYPFDFDDCHYNWFTFDISIPLFYAMRSAEIDENDISYAGRFIKLFIEGYSRENSIDSAWIDKIPDFLKLREIDLYIILSKENAWEINDWCKRFSNNRKQRIENDTPVIDLDFSKWI